MTPNIPPLQIDQLLRFNPRWWWDPVPDWVLGRIDRDGALAIAVNHLDVHKAVIQAQLGALERTQAILNQHLK